MATPISRKNLLKKFFNFYLCSLLGQEQALNSYLSSLRLAYSQLKAADKFTLAEVEQSIDEMQVDQESKHTLVQLVERQTNFAQLMQQRRSDDSEMGES